MDTTTTDQCGLKIFEMTFIAKRTELNIKVSRQTKRKGERKGKALPSPDLESWNRPCRALAFPASEPPGHQYKE